MRLNEFMEATGATQRQIDYWVRHDIPLALERTGTGSGRYRRYRKELIPRIRLLVKISNAIGKGGKFSIDALREIFYCYDLGGYELAEGLTLEWEVTNGTDGTPESCSRASEERADPVRGSGYREVRNGHGVLYEGRVDP